MGCVKGNSDNEHVSWCICFSPVYWILGCVKGDKHAHNVWRALAFNQDGRCWNIAGVARKTSMFGEIPSKRLVSFHIHGVTMIAKEKSRVDRIYYDDQSKG
jgi:hypothetical protein